MLHEVPSPDEALRTLLLHWSRTIRSFRVYFNTAQQLLRERDQKFKPSVLTRQLFRKLCKDHPDAPMVKSSNDYSREKVLTAAKKLSPDARAALLLNDRTGVRLENLLELRQGDLTWTVDGGRQMLQVHMRADKVATHAYPLWHTIYDKEMCPMIVKELGVDHVINPKIPWDRRPCLFTRQAPKTTRDEVGKTGLVRYLRHHVATTIARAGGMMLESLTMGHSVFTARRYMDAPPREAFMKAMILAPPSPERDG